MNSLVRSYDNPSPSPLKRPGNEVSLTLRGHAYACAYACRITTFARAALLITPRSILHGAAPHIVYPRGRDPISADTLALAIGSHSVYSFSPQKMYKCKCDFHCQLLSLWLVSTGELLCMYQPSLAILNSISQVLCGEDHL